MTIAFRCDRCGQLYRVPPEFAGRAATCRTCGAPLTAPRGPQGGAVEDGSSVGTPHQPSNPPRFRPVEPPLVQLSGLTAPAESSQGADEARGPASSQASFELPPERVAAHVERTLGPISGHYRISDTGEIGVARVPAGRAHPWTTLVTLGMSRRPMRVPADAADADDHPTRVELALGLPASWPLGGADGRGESILWPVRLLQTLSRLPDSPMPNPGPTAIRPGTLALTGDRPGPFVAGEWFVACLMLPPVMLPEELSPAFPVPGVRVDFLGVILLYEAEWTYCMKKGLPALLKRLERRDVGEVFDPDRRPVV